MSTALRQEGPTQVAELPDGDEGSDTTALVRRAQTGDRAAFGVLYQRHYGLVRGILLCQTSPAVAQDLAQDVFLLALRQLPALREPSAFGSWLARIARNRAKMHFRQERDTVSLPADLAAPHAATDGLSTADVLKALQSLPAKYREALVLRLVEEMSGEEIAMQTGLSHGTVRVYLHHGMKLLRERLGGDHA